MKLKTQIKMYQKLVSELGRKYDEAEDFINTRVKEFLKLKEFLEFLELKECFEHGIPEEVRFYIFLCCVYSLVTNAFKNESF